MQGFAEPARKPGDHDGSTSAKSVPLVDEWMNG